MTKLEKLMKLAKEALSDCVNNEVILSDGVNTVHLIRNTPAQFHQHTPYWSTGPLFQTGTQGQSAGTSQY